MRPSLRLLVLAVAGLVAPSLAQTPPTWPSSMTPQQVGINYPIVACRMPTTGNQFRDAFPDARNDSLYVGRGTQLILLQPDGTEQVLFDPGPNGAVADPCVSFDAKTIYFTWFEDPQDINTQRNLSRSPSHICKVDIATTQFTQLTSGDDVAWTDSSHQVDPQYAKFDVAPLELPTGKILFLSSRDGTMDVQSRFPAMKFHRMDPDGSNVEVLENFTQGSCQHPVILMDGRIIWTHLNAAGRRSFGQGNYPLFAMNPDGSDIKTFAGAHHPSTAWHFTTQLSGGDIVSCVYYHQNNFGHGTLVRFPVDPQDPSGNVFTPTSTSHGTWHNWGNNSHYQRIGEHAATPWTYNFNPAEDQASPFMPDGSRAGKCTMPAAAPGGHMLLVWSHGNVNALNRPTPELPHMKICLAPNGQAALRQDLIILKEDPNWQYMYPRPVVTYQDIYGIPRPAHIPDTANDGSSHTVLPAGSPFATTGTSSLYNRESHWPDSYDDPWDVNIINNYALFGAFFHVGQDAYAFPDSEIWAAQVVADMSHVDRRYLSLSERFRSHNNGNQLWGILGEVPVRKQDAAGNPVLDPNGDPDTSYEVRIPADVPFHHRIIDVNGLTLTSEQTWHAARPGERKVNCGGCHAHSHDTSPLDFGSTFAGLPGSTYGVTDFALQTPLVDRDVSGNPTVTIKPQKIKIVEYHQDVKPILDAKCVGCHGDVNPAAGLDLQGADAWDALAFTDGALYGHHQRTRWVRKQAAAQSLLVWKVFGSRLDGRTNAERTTDVDYTGDVMPPPSSGIPPLTFEEKRTIAQWIDLGCLVDLSPGQPLPGDPFDDQMKPTLTVSGVAGGYVPMPLPAVGIGVYDLHSGVAPGSLQVIVEQVGPGAPPPTGNLAQGLTVADGQTVSVPLPSLTEGARYDVRIAVADNAGNVSRRTLTLTPVQSASSAVVGTGSLGSAGVPTLDAVGTPRLGNTDFAIRITNAAAGAPSFVYHTSSLAPAPISVGANAFVYLDAAELVTAVMAGHTPFASAFVAGDGTVEFDLPIPDDPSLSGHTVHFQGWINDSGGQPLGQINGALTPALTIVLGG